MGKPSGGLSRQANGRGLVGNTNGRLSWQTSGRGWVAKGAEWKGLSTK